VDNQSSFSIEIPIPDLAPYREGNTGIPYVSSFDSGRPGPHVLVCALTHGNEICGAIALDTLLRRKVRPLRGKLTLAFNNLAAFEQFNARAPMASRFVDEDFNRVWSPEVLDGPRDSTELRRARALRPLVDSVDFLLDIHSMHYNSPPLLLSGPLEKGARFARELGAPEVIMSDEGHKAGRRLRDYGGFGDPDSPCNALLVECGQHWLKSSPAVALDTTFRFLRLLGVIDPVWAARYLPDRPPVRQRLLQVEHAVTVETSEFAFLAPYRGLEVIAKAGTVIATDGKRKVKTPYDKCVLVMPGPNPKPGVTAVRLGRYFD
jgi:predicted deacylase